MGQTVEISLRIPSLRVRREGQEAAETIGNADIRFSKRVELDTVPKSGDLLEMTVGEGERFACEVIRADWHDDKDMFVVACRYAKRSITQADYEAMVNATDWQMRPLLEP
jgi:hypothetical protein